MIIMIKARIHAREVSFVHVRVSRWLTLGCPGTTLTGKIQKEGKAAAVAGLNSAEQFQPDSETHRFQTCGKAFAPWQAPNSSRLLSGLS